MAFTEKYILICDDVRPEVNGKLIIIGLYQDTMTVPQLPFSLPSLTFLAALDTTQVGEFGFKAKFRNLETGKTFAQAMGNLQIKTVGRAITLVQFRNVQLDSPGSYQFSLAIDEEVSPITASINVMLVIPQQRQQ